MHHRPTGGGGGDGENGDKHPQRRRGPRELLEHSRRVLFFALSADLLLFIILSSVFWVQRHMGHLVPNGGHLLGWKHFALPPILWASTALLLLSGVTMEMARQQMFSEMRVMEEWFGLGRPTVRRAVPWLVATAALGALFLAGEWTAWSQLRMEWANFRMALDGLLFPMLMAAHGLHLLLGLLALVAVFPALLLAKRMELRQTIVDCVAWYWYAMCALWVFLFGLLLGAR
jgi:cytochrome c oxidase subunit 3